MVKVIQFHSDYVVSIGRRFCTGHSRFVLSKRLSLLKVYVLKNMKGSEENGKNKSHVISDKDKPQRISCLNPYIPFSLYKIAFLSYYTKTKIKMRIHQ